MKKWKMIMCMALAGTLLAGGSFSSWAKLSDYDAETAARLQDDKLEYDELENLIREYNPEISYAYKQLDFSDDDTASTVRNLKDSIEKEDYKDTVKALKEQKKQLEAMPDFEGKDAALQELKTAIKGWSPCWTPRRPRRKQRINSWRRRENRLTRERDQL